MSDECECCQRCNRSVLPEVKILDGAGEAEWATLQIPSVPSAPSVTVDGVPYELEPAPQFANVMDAVRHPDYDGAPYVSVNGIVFKGIRAEKQADGGEYLAIEINGSRWVGNEPALQL